MRVFTVETIKWRDVNVGMVIHNPNGRNLTVESAKPVHMDLIHLELTDGIQSMTTARPSEMTVNIVVKKRVRATKYETVDQSTEEGVRRADYLMRRGWRVHRSGMFVVVLRNR